VHAVGPHHLTLMHIWSIPAALMFFWYGLHGELPPLLWIVAFRTLCTSKVNADESPKASWATATGGQPRWMTAAPSLAVVVAVPLTGESMTASCQPASIQFVTATDGCRCEAGLEILRGRSRLVSDVRRRGAESS